MVLKLNENIINNKARFESYVILYGTKTGKQLVYYVIEFESYVILYGTKTIYNLLYKCI